MVSIAARTVDEYLAQLPPERRAIISAVRDVILKHLPSGYEEAPAFGMIGYAIPLERYPDTYNGQPLCYAGLAAQKNFNALYLMHAYQDAASAARLAAAFKRIGKPLDMGKSCIRFQRIEDLPLDAIGKFIAERSVDAFIADHEAVRAASAQKRAATKRPAKRAARKRSS